MDYNKIKKPPWRYQHQSGRITPKDDAYNCQKYCIIFRAAIQSRTSVHSLAVIFILIFHTNE